MHIHIDIGLGEEKMTEIVQCKEGFQAFAWRELSAKSATEAQTDSADNWLFTKT